MMPSSSAKGLPDRLAAIISVIFHPLLMPLYGLLVVFSTPTLYGYLPFVQKKFIVFILATNNILLPFSMLPYLKWRRVISSWTIDSRTERVTPLALTTFFYLVSVYVVMKFTIPGFIKALFIASAFISLAVTVINFWVKISIHSAGAGALTAMIIFLSLTMHTPLLPLVIAAILVSGLILSSRLWLQQHTPAEVWTGFLLGFASMALILILF
ncbi:MAG TPA: hypothetical protein PLV06_05730 [Bacteroidales bacterium]|nr:hypothetical protein [Bacteroidales bacterium]HPF02144.1 hypothetical protein [Bacteroidales bacterium]HPJ60258.1 hypothetical protein [Bacteroidales bacterium]HPR11866.1 hypothetical protein [Bacteroidales bacterium]HRW83985.1 hypothetical protein [Bacteroidales bacterium]